VGGRGTSPVKAFGWARGSVLASAGRGEWAGRWAAVNTILIWGGRPGSQSPLMPASVQIRSTRSAVYPVNSTISACVMPDMAAPAIARARRFRASTSSSCAWA
jgi:hypothetical protein